MVGRRDLRRPHGHAPAARAQHQPAPAGHRPGQPRRQRQRAAALPGLRHHPALRERGPLRSTTACSSTWSGASATGWASAWPTRSRKLRDNGDDKREPPVQRLRRHAATGASRTTTAPTCSTSTTSTSCRSGATRTRCSRSSSAAGRSRASPTSSPGGRSSVWRGDDIAGVGDTTAQPWNLVGDPTVAEPAVLERAGPQDQNFWFNPPAFPRPAAGHVRQRRPQRTASGAGLPELGHRALQERPARRPQAPAAPAGGVQLHQPSEPRRPQHGPSSGSLDSAGVNVDPTQRRLRARADEDRRAQHPAGGEVQLLT